MRLLPRLKQLERRASTSSGSDLCPTCGEPRAWALRWECGAPRCLDCGGVIMYAGSPDKHPPPLLSPMIDARRCEHCGERTVTARYLGQAGQLCERCWSST